MIRAVVDEVVPADLVTILADEHIVVDHFPEDWRALPDGALIKMAAKAGYDWLVTCDKRMPFQQNLFGHTISVLVLPTPRVPDLTWIRDRVLAALLAPLPGNFIRLDTSGLPFEKPAPHIVGSARRAP